jgi:phospholipase C
MGRYDTKALPIYQYLHSPHAPNYVIADHFFQAAFGGSFLNHQWLIAARSPLDTSGGALGAKNSVLDSNGMPNSYPQYTATSAVTDGQLTQKCADGGDDAAAACGNFAVNTVQPSSTPSGKGAKIPLIDDTAYPNIGDRLSAKGISWNWYAGGWDDAVAGHPGPNFQYHHQPFNYFANYADGAPGRSHLQDEKNFLTAAQNGTLPQVSFVKPYGSENEHPGYASEHTGSDHLVDLIKAITSGPQAKQTLIVVTYDEFGGSYDHVAPPKVDAWGPGTRIPALVLSASMQHSGVSHATYDTTSILATIEHSFDLAPLSSRDASVNDLAQAVDLGGRHVDSSGR